MTTSAQPVAAFLAALMNGEPSRSDLAAQAYTGLTPAEFKDLEERGYQLYRGKVRDVLQRGERLQVIHTDRLTAFDRPIANVPYRGVMLAAVTRFWLEETAGKIPTQAWQQPHERVLNVERLSPVRAEIIVRGYLAGSMMRAYAKGERRFCGVSLPDGLKPYDRLPEPIVTPTTKAEGFVHDENSSAAELIERGVCTAPEWDTIAGLALRLFALGQERYGNAGWLLVDTKYEMGRDATGQIKVMDEIHTPDSSRLWVAKTYRERLAAGREPEMFDKEIVRRYLLEQGFSGEGAVPEVPPKVLVAMAQAYLKVTESLLGRPLLSEGPPRGIPAGL